MAKAGKKSGSEKVNLDKYRVKPGAKADLSAWDPDDKSEFGVDKDGSSALLLQQNVELEELQEMLFAENKHKVLIVLQAMDTAGKDGVIRHVFEGVNPAGVRVAPFKAPTPEELAHDYLWRIHKQTPARGQIVIFNRSHYESVLVERVLDLVPEEVWSKRYDHINEFERMLADEGTTILKFYLHITFEEQAKRLQERLDDPTKQWKFALGDLDTRKQWPDYMKAYEEALSKTSTEWAPWYVVPANRKWYRNLVISHAIIDTLRGLKMKYPEPKEDLSGVVVV